MKPVFSQKFIRLYHEAPHRQQRQFDKQLEFLLKDFRHPSLHTKIHDEAQRIWQARVDGGWRFYFQVRGDTIYLLTMRPHPK